MSIVLGTFILESCYKIKYQFDEHKSNVKSMCFLISYFTFLKF